MKVSIHNSLPSSYVVCDTETSGLNKQKDRLLEVAILKVDNHIPSEPQHKVIKVPFSVPPKITELTGIDDKLIEEEGEPLEEVLQWLVDQIKPYEAVVGHNFFAFDHHFLVYESRRVESTLPEYLTLEKIVDTAVLFKGYAAGIPRREYDSHIAYAQWVLSQWLPIKFNLKHACGELGIDLNGITLHRAGGDVYSTHKLYEKLREMDI